MTFLQSIVLGLVQGLTEFLPVSSSAHLIIVPWLLGWQEGGGLTFDMALHAGTLLAVLAYFHKDWLALSRAVLRLRWQHLMQPLSADGEIRLAFFLVVATVPAAILGVLFAEQIESTFRNPPLNAMMLAVMGVVLWLVDKKSRKNLTLEKMSLRQALFVGCLQGFALVPGVSRSGSTITAGLLLGFDRAASARFSFLLSFPIIAGACVFKLRHLQLANLDPVFWVGVVTSATSGYLAIGGLLWFLKNRSYGVFAVYRIALSAVVFFTWWMGR